MRAWMDRRGLALKWFLSLFVLTSILLGTLAWNSLHDAEKVLKRQYLSSTETLNDKINHILDIYVDNIKTTLRQLSVRPELLRGKSEAVPVLQSYSDLSQGYVKTFYWIGTDGSIYSSKQLIYELVGNPQLQELYDLAREKSRVIQWTEPYESKLSGKTVAFVQPVYDASQRFVGVLAAEIDLDTLNSRLLPLLSGYDRTFTILTAQQNVLSIEQESTLIPYNVYPRTMSEAFREQLASLPQGVSAVSGPKGKMTAVKSFGNRMGWSLITLIDENYFYRATSDLSDNLKQTALIWFAILILGTWLMTRRLVSPIRLLISKMDRVHNLEYPSAIAVGRSDEIGKLAQSYNDMMSRIFQLVQTVKSIEQDKKEYELKMLQSQIGPHFLYNTLACISSLSKQQRFAEVDETIRSLTHLLSFSFDKISEFVTLEHELQAIRAYAYIQTIRYGNRFELAIEVPKELLAMQVLKLSIQPIIENAIFHGIIPAKRKGKIIVRATRRNQELHIVVYDNGAGMDRAMSRSVLTDRFIKKFSRGFNHVGLQNVHHRIGIYSGSKYGLKITSSKRRGTIVRIIAPIQYEPAVVSEAIG
ncbi:cache domain-containing sensor histidine kinase [Paenibacillus thalictri]|uniref:cache domain-containing sensor histidine kinase n=1 Tax=Paenibacillus thalictri TaxID=2527873 RepID=UPI0013EEF5B3|nr:sensor histidine kinase [Paenibacillus thalictri]